MKNTGDVMGDFEGRIRPELRFSSRNLSNSACSFGDRGYTLQFLGSESGSNSITWSHIFLSGKVSKDSFANTSSNSFKYSGIVDSAFTFLLWASASLCDTV